MLEGSNQQNQKERIEQSCKSAPFLTSEDILASCRLNEKYVFLDEFALNAVGDMKSTVLEPSF